MSKHDTDTNSGESHDENRSRLHGGPTSVSRQSVTADALSVGDVVVVDRSVGSIEAKTFATVVAIDGRGSRLVGPDYPSPAFGAALHIERVTGYDRLVGRDGDGAYHLLRRSPGGDRLLEVVEQPDDEPVHEQRIVSDRVLAQWIEHVDECQEWDSVVSEFEALVGVDRGDGIETDGGHSGGGSERSGREGKQVAFRYNPEKLQVAEPTRNGRYAVCPDCKSRVGKSKSGGKPLPDSDITCFGWSCDDCNLTLPSNCLGPSAPGFNDKMAGAKIEFRDGKERWVPVPIRYAESESDKVDCGDGPRTDGGAELVGPGWFVIERPKRDPARVVAGPKDRDAAESHARHLTTRARIMHTPALVNAIKNEGYNVEWYSSADKPRSLGADSDQGGDSA